MIQLLLIALLSLIAQSVFPWWSLAVVAFAVCLWRSRSGGQAFLVGFAGVALVWLVYALFIHIDTGGVFTGRMSQLLFRTASAAPTFMSTAVVGGLVGGLAALSGYLVRQAVRKPLIARDS